MQTTTARADVAAGTEQRSRVATFVVTVLGIATFGPYLLQSVRTEQAAVYGLVLPGTRGRLRSHELARRNGALCYRP